MNTLLDDEKPARAKENVKLPVSAHLLCGWPLFLVVIGGLVGGGLGGAAYATNLAIYKSELPAAAKVLLNIVVGLAAFAIWFAVVLAVAAARM